MTHADFWIAIHECPDDDTPRLVYADWLDELGDDSARAELIRAQVRAASLDEDDPERAALAKRSGQLEAENEARWLQPLAHWVPLLEGDEPAWVLWKRGFVHDLHFIADSPAVLDRIDPFLAEHPLEKVTLAPAGALDLDALGRMVAACTRLDNLRDLELREGGEPVRPKTLQVLGSAPHLARLRRLDLAGELDRKGVRALFQSPLLDRITDLAFHVAYGVGAQAMEEVLATGGLARLQGLAMRSCRIGPRGVQLLCGSRHSAALRNLDLANNEVTDEGVAHLARSTLLGQLQRLDLSLNDLTADACRHLARSKALANLVDLDLGHNWLGDEALTVLLPALSADRLHTLSLAYTELDAGAVAILANSPHVAGLRDIRLDGNPLGDRGAVALAHSPYLAGLRWLHLYNTSIGAEGARALARSPHLDNIAYLSLPESGIPEAERQLLKERFGDAVA
jgi:uncharacterized protein (TIGR02996 family)